MLFRDPVSSISHLLFALWAVYALLLLYRVSPPRRRIPVLIFGGSMIVLYTASGVFHAVPFTLKDQPGEFRFFQQIDQSAIFVLIAGTNTPMMLIFLNGAWRRWCLTLIWSLAFLGVACLWFLPQAPHEIIIALCFGMGWLGVIPIPRYYRAIGWRAMNWALLGCGLYTLGGISEFLAWPVISVMPVRLGYHEIFHLLTMGASFAFFIFVTRFVLFYEPVLEEQLMEEADLVSAEIGSINR